MNLDALTLALVAIGGSIFGIWLGQQLQSRREDRRWRHDRKLETYLSYLDALANYEAMLIGLPHLEAMGGATDDLLRAHVMKLEQRLVTYVAAKGAARTVGSQGVVEAISRIDRDVEAHSEASKLAMETGSAPPPRRDLEPGIAQFVAAARADLGFRG